MTAPTPNAELAYRVWDHIIANPDQHDPDVWIYRWDHIIANPDQHDPDVWIYRGDPECGTAACAAGWACLLSGDTPEYTDPWEDEANTVAYGDGTEMVARRAATLLGIEYDEADVYGHRLFHTGNSVETIARLVAEIFGPRPERAR